MNMLSDSKPGAIVCLSPVCHQVQSVHTHTHIYKECDVTEEEERARDVTLQRYHVSEDQSNEPR